jgi:hypothetical protein
MFLALVGRGRDDQLGSVAEGLLRMAKKRLRGNEKVKAAVRFWKEGLRDEKNKEQADRVYLVMRYVADAVNDLPNQTWEGGGEAVVCHAIRSMIPLAPQGFSQVGKREGNSSQPSRSARIEPHRTTLNMGSRGLTD